jgi:CheY-like chemotaxis protein
MRDYVSRLLAPRYEVHAVADGKEALTAIRDKRPDLLLSDVMMPHVDGFTLVRTLRADPTLCDLPIILLSARAGEDESVQGLDAGADDYLVKPFSERDLYARVAATLKMASVRQAFQDRMAVDLGNMTRLQDIGVRCAGRDNDFHACLEDILDDAIEFTGAFKGTLQLLDRETNTLKIAVHRGYRAPFLNFFSDVHPAEAAACGAAFQAGERVVIEDVTQSEIFAGQPSLHVLQAEGVRAMQSTPLLSSSGEIVGMIATHFPKPHRPDERELRFLDLLARQAADYLDRRLTDETFHKLQSQLQAIFNDTPLGVYLVDHEFRIRGINPTALPAFGNIADLIGRDFEYVTRRIWSQPHADAIIARFRHTLNTGTPYYMPEWIEERLDTGVTEYYEWQISLMEGQYGVVCYFREVSAQVHSRQALAEAGEKLRRMNEQLETRVAEEVAAREEAQARLAQAQRMEALGQLAGGIAHDFNNVLQAVSGGLGLIQRRTENPDLRRYAGMAAEAAARGSAITGRLLSFARQSELRAAPIDPLPLGPAEKQTNRVAAKNAGIESGIC